MTGRLTKDGLRGLAAILAAVLLVGGSLMIAVGGASAAASAVQFTASEVSTPAGSTTELSVDVTADSAGISNKTLAVDVDGTQYSTQTVSVAANTTKTVTVTVDTSASPFNSTTGSYNIAATVGAQSATTTLNVTEPASVTLSQSEYNVSTAGSVDVTATLSAPASSDVSAPPALQIVQNGSVVTSMQKDTATTVGAGNSTTVTWTVDAANHNLTAGDYHLVGSWDSASAAGNLTVVEEPVSGGSTGGSDGGSSTTSPVVIPIGGIVIAVLAIAAFVRD